MLEGDGVSTPGHRDLVEEIKVSALPVHRQDIDLLGSGVRGVDNRIRHVATSFPLQLPGRARCRPFGGILEPLGDLRERGHVDLRRARPGEDAGDIEVGNGEAIPEQVRAVVESAVEHFER